MVFKMFNNLMKLYSRISLIKTNSPKFDLQKIKIKRLFSQSNLDVNTNVAKDVILYKSDQGRFYKVVNLFGLAQFGFWNYLSFTAFTTLKNIPVSDSFQNVWWQKVNFGDSKWKNSLTILSFSIGWGVLVLTWLYTLRSVRYLILRKGGQQATIVTYGPFGVNRMFTLDLKNVSAKEARTAGKSFVPLKVKDHRFHYLVDMRGEFRNPVLFDHTVGVKRVWNT